MTLVSITELLDCASKRRRGVGAFNVILLEHAEALVGGAEQVGAPVVLQISQHCARYHGSLEPIALATLAIARKSSAPVAVHLDHAEDVDLIHDAVALGITSVMFDASRLEYDDNVTATKSVVDYCRRRGVAVEAELGEVGGKDGVHAPGVRTEPAAAAAFVAATGVDSLAVAVGTSHAMQTRDAVIDHRLIAQIRAAVAVPLVLHGSSGAADLDLVKAVENGITKVNIATHLNAAFTDVVRQQLSADSNVTDPRRYVGAGRDAVATEAGRLLTLLCAPSR